MRKTILKFFLHHKKEVIVMAASLLVFAVVLLFSSRLIISWSALFIKKEGIQIEASIQQELDYISKQREEIISGGLFNNALKNNDLAQLLTLTQAEAKKRNLDLIIVTDKDGFVLARSHLPGELGDNVFQTTIQGRNAAQGETVTAIVRGARNPLILISNSLVLDENKLIGSIEVGYILNNSFADYFREEHLKQGEQIVFYTLQEGIVGNSFNDQDKTQLINTYFSLGSDLVAQNLDGLAKEIKINGDYYAIRHIIFPGIEKSPGGAFVFFPIRHNSYSLFLASSIVLLFFVFYYLIFILFNFLDYRRHRTPFFLLVGVTLFTVIYFLTLIKLDQSSIELKKSPYLIYNSIIKFEPESDVISQYSGKTIAIKVFTGGEAINVVRAVIQYDPNTLKVLDILTTNSLCDPEGFLDRSIDNKIGQVKITCFTPNINPGFYKPEGIVAELVIWPLAQGGISLKFTEKTQVLASDGFETNVLRKATDAFYQVTSQGLTTANVQELIPVFSPNHSNSNRWYQNKDIQLAWPLIKGGVYYYELNQIPNFTLQNKVFSTVNNYLDLSIKEDGIYYFHLQAKDATGKFGPVSHFKIMVDNTPPLLPNIKVSSKTIKKGGIARLDFMSEDKLSGLQSGFYVSIDEGIFLPVKPPFYVPFLESGDYPIVIRAFDKANNFSDSSIVIHAID